MKLKGLKSFRTALKFSVLMGHAMDNASSHVRVTFFRKYSVFPFANGCTPFGTLRTMYSAHRERVKDELIALHCCAQWPRIRTDSSRKKCGEKVKMEEYPWLSYEDAHGYESEARNLEVSEKARAPKGFMREYEKARTPRNMRIRPLPPGVIGGKNWGQKRHNFIKRHMAQYTKRGATYGRYLALIMWAYMPPGPPPPKVAKR